MADSDIILNAKVKIDKSVDSEFKRINDLYAKAFNSLSSETKESLSRLRENAEKTYRDISKTTGELKAQKDLESAITAQKAEQNRLAIAQKQKSGIETALIKAQNLGKESVVAKRQAELDNINGVIASSIQKIDSLGSTINDLEAKITSLVQQGNLLGESVTFENANVQATNLLDTLERIESKLSEVNLSPITADEIAQAREALNMFDTNYDSASMSVHADNLRGFLDSGVYDDVVGFRQALEGLSDLVGYVREELSQPADSAVLESATESATTANVQFESIKESLLDVNADLKDTNDTVNELRASLAEVGNNVAEGELQHSAIADIASQASDVTDRLGDARDKIASLRSSMQEIKPNLGIEEYQQLDDMLTKVEANFNNILGKIDTLPVAHLSDSLNVEELEGFAQELERTIALYEQMTSEGSQPITTESLEAMRDTLSDVNATIAELNGNPPISGENIISGDASSSVSEVEVEVTALEADIEKLNETPIDIQLWDNSGSTQEAQAEIQQVNTEVEQTSNTANRARSVFAFLGGAITGAFAGLAGHVRSSEKQISQLTSSVGSKLVGAFNRVKGAIEKAFSGRSMKRGLTTLLKYTFGVRSLYFLFRRLRNAVKEGLQNLVKYEKAVGKSKLGVDANGIFQSTNQAITELKTSLLFLKNAWASAFAPIVNYVMPILTSLIDAMAEVGNAIARFVGALTGQSKVLNAVKVNAGDYADSLDGVGSSAKKAKDRLASFDDLNVLGKDSDAGGGGGASSLMPDPSEMFEYVDAVSEFADMIKEAWANADFTKVGALIKDKIVGVLQGINWEDVYTEAQRVGKSAGTFLYGLFGDPVLWEEAGKALAGGLNTITYAFQAFLEETGKIDFGGNFATFLNEFIKNTDWLTAGANINTFFTQIIDNINSFLDTLDIDELSDAIVEFTSGLNLPDLVLDLAGCLIKITDGVIELGADLVAKFGQKLGEDLVIYVNKDRNIVFEDEGEEFVVPYTPAFDWKENPLLALIDSTSFDLGKWIVSDLWGVTDPEQLSEMNDRFQELMNTLFDISQVILTIVACLQVLYAPDIINKGMGLTYLFTTYEDEINTFLEVLKDLGDRIAEDLHLDELVQFFEDVGYQAGLFFEGISKIGEGLSMFWDNLIEGFKEFDLIGLMQEAGFDINSLNTDDIWEMGEAIATGILYGIGKGLIEIPTWIVENVFNPIVDAFCTAFGIHSPSTVFEAYGVDIINGLLLGIQNTVGLVLQAFDDFKTNAMRTWDAIKLGFIEKVNSIKTTITERFIAIKDSIISTVLLLKDMAIQKFMEFKSGVYEVFMSLKEMLKTPINAIIGVIESFINSIIGGLNKFINKFSSISSDLSSVASEYGISIPTISPINDISIPRLAQGAVIPPNKEFMAVLGDQKNGTNIEAPLDTIKQAVAEELSAQIGVLEQGFADVVNAINNKDISVGDKQIGQANARYTARQNLIRGTSF